MAGIADADVMSTEYPGEYVYIGVIDVDETGFL